jgi:hypothetical protein
MVLVVCPKRRVALGTWSQEVFGLSTLSTELAALDSTLSLWTLRFGVEAATYPKSAKSRNYLRQERGTLDQDIQDAKLRGETI